MDNDKLTIKSWSPQDRPREKLVSQGRKALSDAELIAILLGSGSRDESAVTLAQRILSSVNHDLYKLGQLNINDLKKFKGIGEAKAITIIAALELGRRRKDQTPNKKAKILTSTDSYELIKPYLTDLSHEEFWVIFLNRGNLALSQQRISSGGVSATVVDPKIVFKIALEQLASSIILCHNHPSGNLNPSTADKHLTQKLSLAGNTLDIKILDHLIITDNGYYSFADNSLI